MAILGDRDGTIFKVMFLHFVTNLAIPGLTLGLAHAVVII